MASKKRSKKSDDGDKLDESPEVSNPDDLDIVVKPEADTPKEPKPIAAAAPKPREKPAVKYTATRYFAGRRRSNPIAEAFLRTEALNHKTRKLTAEEWEAEWSKFLTVKR